MKALELTIHPPLSPLVKEAIGCNMDNGFSPYFGLTSEIHVPGLLAMQTKRFSDAELAAEVWRETDEYTRTAGQVLYQPGALENDNLLKHFKETERRGHALTRFATSPHYFEEEA